MPMSQTKIAEACDKMTERLIFRHPQLMSVGNPERMPVSSMIQRSHDVPSLTLFKHIRFMLKEIPLMAEDNREKAMRWLGFVQGALYVLGVMSIEDMKQANKPDPE